MRDVILQSWRRCWAQNVPIEQHADKRVLSPAELDARILRHKNLCQVAFPYLDGLFDFIEGSEFLILLSDEEGYILYERGDAEIYNIAERNGLVRGACRSEKRLGTNGIGTVLTTKTPLQVFAAEHYYQVHENWACSGAPIYQPDGSLAGSVCFSGMADKVNDHTLGMAVAAADSISRQLKLKDAYDQMEDLWRNLDVILENVPVAICLLDEELKIKAFNTQVAELLLVAPEKIKDMSFLDVVAPDPISEQEIKNGLTNYSVTFQREKRKFTLSLSVQSAGKHEYVAQMEPLSVLHKRVNKIVGNDAHFSFQDIAGQSPAMLSAIRMAKIAAQNDANVFLSGESGTGKELFAQAIHNASARRDGPFIAVNCGALPKSLIEAELFGYEGGSFTGAKREGCAGKFELAQGGTIFLDEIGDMPFDVQVTLLRVLQNREIRRIGASKVVKIDVRIITATNQDLERLVKERAFREDLFYRINVFHISIPPLRERAGDIRVLSRHFVEKYAGSLQTGCATEFSQEAMAVMEAYTWPGNVRQLENSVERAVYLAAGPQIMPEDLPPEILQQYTESPGQGPVLEEVQEKPQIMSLRKTERQQIEQVLEQTHGNIKEAALLLGISRRTLYRRIAQFEIDCDALRKNK